MRSCTMMNVTNHHREEGLGLSSLRSSGQIRSEGEGSAPHSPFPSLGQDLSLPLGMTLLILIVKNS